MESERRGSLLESLGSEIMGILTPVSACMLMVVILVRALDVGNTQVSTTTSIFTMVYAEDPSDSTSRKLEGAILNALIFVAFVTLATFLLVALFYFRFTKCLRVYYSLSIFTILVYSGAGVGMSLVQTYSIPMDIITFSVLIFNFGVVGVLVVLPAWPVPIVFTQGYLVIIGMLVAFWFTYLPEWTTWVVLLALAAYDMAAVLLPGGPLNLLIELSMKRNEQLPALVYEARPTLSGASRARPPPQQQMRRWDTSSAPLSSPGAEDRIFGRLFGRSYQALDTTIVEPDHQEETSEAVEVETVVIVPEDEQTSGIVAEEQSRNAEDESVPLISRHIESRIETLSTLIGNEERAAEAIGDQLSELSETNDIRASSASEDEGAGVRLESTTEGGLKLGLGDFVFYSVLVGRAAMFDLMTVWACYLAIVAGLGITLALLAVWRRALPALPISISLGVLFYLLTRLVLEPVVLELDTHLLFF